MSHSITPSVALPLCTYAPSTQVRISEAGPADAGEMTQFHNRHHRDNREPSFWLWEYVAHLPGKSVFLAARERDRVVGTQGMIPINLRVGGEVVLTGKSEHSLIEPAFRGHGLWRRLYRQALGVCSEHGMAAVWGFTPVAEACRGLAALGFSQYDVLDEAVTILSVTAAARVVWGSAEPPWFKAILTLGLPFLAARQRAARWFCRREGGEFEFRAEPRAPDDFARFNERLAHAAPGVVRLELSGEYLEWRLHRHPLRRLRIRLLYHDGDIVACALVNDERRLRPVIVDIAFSAPHAGRVLLARLMDEFAADGAGIVLLAANRKNPLGREVLAAAVRLGAVRRRARSVFVVRALDQRASPAALDPAAWQLSLLWFEGYAV